MFSLSRKNALILGGVLLLVSGCASLREYRIDPTGSCIFTRQQSGVVPNTTGESSQPPSVSNPSAAAPYPGSTPLPEIPAATTGTTQPSPFTHQNFPGGYGAAVPGTGMGSGFTGSSGLAEYYTPSAVPDPVSGPALILSPKVHFAPVNSEIVVVASYLGNDKYLRTNQPVEWSLDGAGHIMTYDTGSWCDWVYCDFTSAKKISDRYVKTKTSVNLWTIDRGTADTKDDVEILKGQTWITLKSTKEGTSYVSAMSPTINDWSKRNAGATIHWVDAQFAFPRPSIAPVGESRRLTTIVSRQTTGSPRPGWFVEYEIIGGPAAGLGEGRAQRVKIETDASGQANIDVAQTDLTAGTSTIAVRIIRPPSPESNEGELVVASDVIRQIWTTGGVLTIKLTPPRDAVANQELSYSVRVSNASQRQTAATVRLTLPVGLNYVRSIPTISQNLGNVLQWELAGIPAQGSVDIDVTLKADRTGVASVRAEVFPRSGESYTPQTPAYTPPTTPTVPTQPTTPTIPAQPSLTPTTPTGETPSGYGRTEEPKLDKTMYIGTLEKVGNNLSFPISKDAYFKMGDNSKYVVFKITNNSGRDLKDVVLVFYPPQEVDKLSQALVAANSIDRAEADNRGHISIKYPTLAAGQEAVLPVQYNVQRPAKQVDIFAEVYVQGKKIGEYTVLRTPVYE